MQNVYQVKKIQTDIQADISIVNALARQPSRTEVDLDALAADMDRNTAANIDSREHDSFQASYTIMVN